MNIHTRNDKQRMHNINEIGDITSVKRKIKQNNVKGAHTNGSGVGGLTPALVDHRALF